jgi:hypothetical protein
MAAGTVGLLLLHGPNKAETTTMEAMEVLLAAMLPPLRGPNRLLLVQTMAAMVDIPATISTLAMVLLQLLPDSATTFSSTVMHRPLLHLMRRHLLPTMGNHLHSRAMSLPRLLQHRMLVLR